MRKDVRQFAELAGLPAVEAEPAVPWERSREICGIDFPADYQEFVDTFGAGEIRGYVGVCAPWPRLGKPQGVSGLARFVEQDRDLVEALEDLGCPYPFFPRKGGLLSWGSSVAGDQFFWLTRGPDPMEWPVVVWYRGLFDGNAWRLYNMRFVAFLLHGLSGNADEDLTELFKGWSGYPLWGPPEL